MYRVGQKSDTSRTLHYIVREVSLFLSHPVYTTLFSATVHNNMSHDKLRNVSRLVDDDSMHAH